MAEFGVKYWAELRSRYKGVLWCVETAERGFTGIAEERRPSIQTKRDGYSNRLVFFFFLRGSCENSIFESSDRKARPSVVLFSGQAESM